MALDKNLFTLNLEPSKIEPSALDLIDPSGTIHYRKRLVPNEAGTYLISLSEPLSESILATAAAPAATTKEKVIELHNPSVLVNLTSKGTLTVKWAFTWEEHTFEWKRESCYIIRKPDPPVLVAVTREPNKTNKTTTVQILDYNLNRFDIEDRKGLEIVLLTSLLTFGDLELMRAKSNEASSAVLNVPAQAAAGVAPPPPPPPPKPEGWTEDQIAVLQAQEQHEVNEVVVGEQGDVNDYVNHCVSLLNDDTLLFITLRSLTPSCVAKVVQVAEATKRRQYKETGYDDDQELHQYVDTSAGKGKGKSKGPRVINLDDAPNRASTYQPPNSLTIHLSKIAMPELEPKTNKPKPSPSGGHVKAVSEPERQKVLKSNKEKRQSSAAALAPLAPPPSSRQTPSPSKGLLATHGAFTSGSSSSTPKSRPLSSSSAPKQQPAAPPPAQAQPRPGHSSRPLSSHLQPSYSIPSQPPLPQQQSRPNHPPQAQNLKKFQLQGNLAPPFNSQLPAHPPQQGPSRPVPVRYVASYPGPYPPNVPPTVYGLVPPQPQPPPPQRASGKGFFSRR